MEHKNKPLSHFERLQRSLPHESLPHVKEFALTFSKKYDNNLQRFVSSSEVKPRESIKAKFSDFSLENIIATGATHMLNPTSLSPNVDTAINAMDDSLSVLDKTLSNNNNNNN